MGETVIPLELQRQKALILKFLEKGNEREAMMIVDGLIARLAHSDQEMNGYLELIPAELRIIVREGGGLEDIYASTAASIANTVRKLTRGNVSAEDG